MPASGPAACLQTRSVRPGSRQGPPASATPVATGLAGLTAAIAALILIRETAWAEHLKALATLAATAAAMVAVDLFCFRADRNPTTGLAPRAVNPFSPGRFLRKCVGLLVTLGALYGGYALFPEYASG